MANNTTFVLPEWLITKEPVAVILSVVLALPFFVKVSQNVQKVVLPWKWCKKDDGKESSSLTVIISFIVTVLGSIAIAVSAPLIAGNAIVKNHPTANRWTIIEQWSTRPRVTIFVFISNLIATRFFKDDDQQGFMKTAVSSLISEIVMELFGIRFIMKQSSVPHQVFDPKFPCTESAIDSKVGQIPDNCPTMQKGALNLRGAILLNASLVALFLLCLLCMWLFSDSESGSGDDGDCGMCLTSIVGILILAEIFVIYVISWVTWSSFLHKTPVDLYCIEGSALVDLVYCLLPVALGLWRLLWAVTMEKGGQIA